MPSEMEIEGMGTGISQEALQCCWPFEVAYTALNQGSANTPAQKIRVNEKIVQEAIRLPDRCEADRDNAEECHDDTFLTGIPVKILKLKFR